MLSTFRLTTALALMTVVVLGAAAPAQAHTAVGAASCSGAVLDANTYDDAQANRYSLTLDQETVAGTFGASVHQSIPVPQDGAVHTWSYTIEAADGSYRFSDSGEVGPCGAPPAVDACPSLAGDQPAGTACAAPPDRVVTTDSTALDCDAREQITTTTTTTTPFVFDQATQSWAPGTPVETQTVNSHQVQPGDCTQTPGDQCPDVAGVQGSDHACGGDHTSAPPSGGSSISHPAVFAPSLPTVLPATGAAPVASSHATWTRLIGAGVLTVGFVLLGGLAVGRRRNVVA